MRQERRRRHVGTITLMLLKPFVRYSLTRDAYVLRAIGNRVGPVLRAPPRHRTVERAPSGPPTEGPVEV